FPPNVSSRSASQPIRAKLLLVFTWSRVSLERPRIYFWHRYMANRESRVELKGSARTVMPGGQDVGPADLNQQIEVTVYLRRPSGEPPNVEHMGALPVSERNYLSREEFAKSHGARTEDFAKVRAFAANYGLRITSEDLAARRVRLAGTV